VIGFSRVNRRHCNSSTGSSHGAAYGTRIYIVPDRRFVRSCSRCVCVFYSPPPPRQYTVWFYSIDGIIIYIYIYTHVCQCDPREGFVCASDRKTLWGSCTHTRRCNIYVFMCVWMCVYVYLLLRHV